MTATVTPLPTFTQPKEYAPAPPGTFGWVPFWVAATLTAGALGAWVGTRLGRRWVR